MSNTGKRKITVAGSEHEVLIVENRDDRYLLVEYDGIPFEIFLGETKSGNRLAVIDGIPLAIGEATRDRGIYTVFVSGKKVQVIYTQIGRPAPLSHVRPPIEVTKLRSTGGEDGRVIAHMPGRIVSVKVKLGDLVKNGDPLLVLMAMKMENTLVAPSNGIVREIHVEVGVTVNKGDLLAVIA